MKKIMKYILLISIIMQDSFVFSSGNSPKKLKPLQQIVKQYFDVALEVSSSDEDNGGSDSQEKSGMAQEDVGEKKSQVVFQSQGMSNQLTGGIDPRVIYSSSGEVYSPSEEERTPHELIVRGGAACLQAQPGYWYDKTPPDIKSEDSTPRELKISSNAVSSQARPGCWDDNAK